MPVPPNNSVFALRKPSFTLRGWRPDGVLTRTPSQRIVPVRAGKDILSRNVCFVDGIRVEDVGTLGNLEALIKSRDSIGELSLEPVSAKDGGRLEYISAMESIYTTLTCK